MKRLSTILGLVLVFVMGLIVSGALACDGDDCNFTKVTGQGAEGVFWSHGTENTGGEAAGESRAAFEAIGKKKAWGELDVEGNALGNSSQGPNSASSWSLSVVSSEVEAKGKRHTEIGISGWAGETNWATVGTDNAFATGGNSTYAEYQGDLSGRGRLSGEGGAIAGGGTITSVVDTPIEKQASALTKGGSLAYQKLSGDPLANGTGAAQTGVLMEKPGALGVATGQGSANYCVTGPNLAAGVLNINSSSTTKLLSDGISASSHVESRGKTIGK